MYSAAVQNSATSPKTYTGGCHCGAVRYEAQTDLRPVISCNCSICSKRGYLLTFVPPSDFQLLAGKDQLSDYQFNTRSIHHLFCKTCGTSSFGSGKKPDGSEMYSINVRCLDGVDIDSLTVTRHDGKSS
ncbi:MAG: GFA family protein [Myxococcales bacterium]|nr:GFA family protein [Myxococcales bacterium]MCB9708076.1 GFA family protein [Myxococcales bacterium]